MVNISIIGSGVVGTRVGRGFRKIGNDVIFYDISEERVKNLKDSGLNATADLKKAVHGSDISFITVPTPSSEDGSIDLSYIKDAIKSLARVLGEKNDYHLVVIKSTVIPTTTKEIVKPLLEKFSGKSCGKDFGLCSNPEFLTEIHGSWSDDPEMRKDFFTEDRIVIGEFDKKSGDILEKLYKPLESSILRTDLHTAEMIKYASNCILASRIIPWYDFKPVCEKLGIDVDVVAKGVTMDNRIGRYGSVITGKGYQGKCLPKDVKAFINFAKDLGTNPKMFETIDKINEDIQKKDQR